MLDVKTAVVGVGSLFGYLILAQSAVRFLRARWVSPLELTKIGTASFVIAFLVGKVVNMHSLMQLWLVVNAAPVLVFVSTGFLIYSRRRTFEARVDELLVSLLFLMKQGNSMRSALDIVTQQSSPTMRVHVRELTRAVVFSQQESELELPEKSSKDDRNSPRSWLFDRSFARLVSELRWIDRESPTPVRSLNDLRERLRNETKIRRRSGQATAQTRAQSIVMTLLFVALAIFSMSFFGTSEVVRWILLSAPLFIVGSIWIWRGGRRIRWTA
ncbi:MAG: hypothetical protein JNJ49_15965 [Bdellovibrionaceae bacterium]|nr:hypothetical protein [Pseudobdellovibrionaceae bacterium]